MKILWVAAAVAAVALGWRFASRRRSLPCPVWLRWMVELDNPFAPVCRARAIVEHLDLAPGMTVLDGGCGPGRVTVPLARAVGPRGEVVALDLQQGMLDRARASAEAAGLANVRFLRAGLGEGALEEGRFDRALLVMVLGEIPDRERALAELFRALRPGGILSVTELVCDPHFQRRRTLAGLAEAAGFRERAFFGGSLAYTIHFERPRS